MILGYLKENTNDIHKELEQINLAKYIMDHSISLESYKTLLVQNFKFYYVIEKALMKCQSKIHPSLHPFLSSDKSQLLKQDLTTLGYDINSALSECAQLDIPTEGAAIGALYVSEGSALGGLVISKHLSACRHLEHISKHHFFGKEVNSVLERWKKFNLIISTNFEGELENKEEILKSTTQTFQLFEKIIRQ